MHWTTFAVAFLLAFPAFNAQFIQHKRQLNIISTQSATPSCEKCVLPKPTELGDLKKAIQDLRLVLKDTGKLLVSVFKNILTSMNNTKFAVQRCVSEIMDDIVPGLDELSKAVSNINTCPSLKALCTTLQNNLIAFVDSLDHIWPMLLTESNLLSVQYSFLESLSDMKTQIFTIYRDTAYNLLQTIEPALCETLGKTIYELLNPYGDLAARVAELLRNASKSEMHTLLQKIFEDVASGGSSGSLNVFEIPSQALCILASVLHINTIGDSDCANPLTASKDLACSIVNLLINLPGLSRVSVVPLPILPSICTSIL